MNEKDRFLYPRNPYRGEYSPEATVFDANLQEFAQKIGYICSLENNGKMSPARAYREIKTLYKQLRASKRELGIGEESEGGSST
jgi:hypothetical protein